MTTTGYVYCMSNPAMPGLLKIGYTERPVEDRLQEANSSTWVPADFSIELAKYVRDPNHKEQVIHRILKDDRANPKREFFRTSPEEVKQLFELMDGTWWDPETMEEEDQPVFGYQVVQMFLDKHIHPAGPGAPALTAGSVGAAFKEWKTREGYKYGRPEDVIDKLRSAYGNPRPGIGWVGITLRKF